MIRRVQDALRDNPGVVAAAARAHRRPARVAAGAAGLGRRLGDEPGRGGARPGGPASGHRRRRRLRPARVPHASPMRGLVLLTLADGADSPRLALGQGSWRWSDLTGAR